MSEIAFTGGRILTMDDRQPLAEAVLIRGGRVAAVGSDHDVRAAATSACHFEDLAGRHVIPGIVDGHCHLELTATHLAYAVSCHLATHPSIRAITEAVAARAAETPPGEWVIGRSDFGLPLYVDERRAIERADLDAAVPDHPCVVFSGLHLCTLNTTALRVCGLLDGSAILPRGAAVDVASGRAKEIWDWLPLPTLGLERIAAAIRDDRPRTLDGAGRHHHRRASVHARRDRRACRISAAAASSPRGSACGSSTSLRHARNGRRRRVRDRLRR